MKLWSKLIVVAATVIVGSSSLGGCAIGECLEYRNQVVTRQVCDSRASNTGFCSSWRTETRTENVCVRRADVKDDKPQVDPQISFDERIKELKALAVTNSPPRNFESCKKMAGTWYAECEQRDGRTCLQASNTKGYCAKYALPNAQTRQACNAVNGYFEPRCLRYDDQPGKFFQCAQPASYGWCTANNDPERTIALFEINGVSGKMTNPNVLKPGTTAAAFERALKIYTANYPPKDFDRCLKLEGSWQGVCTRKEGGKCVQASRTQGQCNNYVVPEFSEREECVSAGKSGSFRDNFFQEECLAYGVGTDGKETCAKKAGFGKCTRFRAYPYMSTRVDLFYIGRDGKVDPTPRPSH